MLEHEPDGVFEIGIGRFAALERAPPELALGVAAAAKREHDRQRDLSLAKVVADILAELGGFAAIVGMPARSPRAVIARQLAYSAGRITTYSMLGALAGYAGTRLAKSACLPAIVNVVAVMTVVCDTSRMVRSVWWSCGWDAGSR